MSKRALVYDTETTGFPLFKDPSTDPRQPHLVQLAAALVDLDTQKVLSSMDVIIEPTTWVIPPEVSEVHGITHQHALDVGVREAAALVLFMDMWQSSDLRIGHNEAFDARIIRIALARYRKVDHDSHALWKDGPAECTMGLSMSLAKVPPTAKMLAAGRTHYKSPTLGEAYEAFGFGKLEGAHNALVDVMACLKVYFACKDVHI